MTEFSPYFFLFKDVFASNLLLVPPAEYAADTMLIFGTYNKYSIFSIAIFAALFSSVINFYIGMGFRHLEKYDFLKDRSDSLKEAEEFFIEKKLIFLLLLAFVPLWGTFLTCAAGVFRSKIRLSLILIAISHVGFYGFKVLNLVG
jgi:membrane protein YqaA with SNARE-associated domain